MTKIYNKIPKTLTEMYMKTEKYTFTYFKQKTISQY